MPTKLFSGVTLVVLIQFFSLSAFSQECGQVHFLENLKKTQPQLVEHWDKEYAHSLEQLVNEKTKKEDDTLYRIPVVFNVLYTTSYKPTRQDLDSIITILNDGFNARSDTSTVRPIFKDIIGNVHIEFYIADSILNGANINAINYRTYYGTATSGDTAFKLSRMGGLDAILPQYCLNIWLCNNATFGGFAYPPLNAAHWDPRYYSTDKFQGVAMIQSHMFKTTIIHEVGHYLGLRHIWGDGQQFSYNKACFDYDDGLDDTPFAALPGFRNCQQQLNTCRDQEDDRPDQYENYMDYSDCKVMFTKQQKQLMRYNLTHLRPLVYTSYIAPDTPDIDIHRLTIFPNPNFGQLQFYYPLSLADSTVEVTIRSALGIVVKNQVVTLNEQHVISTTDLSSGLYYVNVSNLIGENILNERLIVCHE